jgi:hypothetical protein
MASGPGQAVLGWVAGVLATGPPEVVCGLRDGASPWLLRAGGREVVLRVGRPAIAHELATEAAALELAAGVGVSVPELLGSDDGRAAGVPVVLSASPPDMGWFPVSMALQGRPDLDQPTMLARRDEFVRQALDILR